MASACGLRDETTRTLVGSFAAMASRRSIGRQGAFARSAQPACPQNSARAALGSRLCIPQQQTAPSTNRGRNTRSSFCIVRQHRMAGGSIPLELDHVDGDRTNNLLCNLRLVCPNCHALTPTYRGRNIALRRSKFAALKSRASMPLFGQPPARVVK